MENVGLCAALIALLWSGSAFAQSPPTSFYVRGDAGGSFPSGGDVSGFGPSPLVGAGAGIKILPFLRTDVTVAYRTGYHDKETSAGVTGETDLKVLTGMINAYFDFPTIAAITPYIGGGAGLARDEVGTSTFTSGGVTVATLSGATKTNFAWQVGGGAAIGVAPAIAIDIGYHYLDAGNITTGVTAMAGGGAVTVTPATARFHAHEVTAGIRFGF